jgi:hypothetical protein
MHISYDDAPALDRQLALFLENDELKPDSRYLFDKLLHNDYRLRLDRLELPGVKILLALREPEQSIKSIVNLFAQKETDEPYASPLEAANYYIDRVAALADFCRDASRGYYYFDAEMLQCRPDVLLPGLTRWLDLDSPLSDRYEVFRQTGQHRKGDSSNVIRTGRVVAASRDYSTIRIPAASLEAARQAYRDCRRQIIRAALDSLTL